MSDYFGVHLELPLTLPLQTSSYTRMNFNVHINLKSLNFYTDILSMYITLLQVYTFLNFPWWTITDVQVKLKILLVEKLNRNVHSYL